ncbi:hypothetical protein GCM10027048_32910 [Hymenobacter coalescens]
MLRAGSLLPLAALGWLPVHQAQAQGLNYQVAGAVNTTTAYADLGTAGTVITTANTDDANSTAQPIGFSFSYNGATFTDFVLNTNGIMRLGTAAPSVANLFANFEANQAPGIDPTSSTSTANVNLLAPFNFDLESGTAAGGAEYRVATTGAAPNRVCTIQWKNVRDKAGIGATGAAAQYDSFSFQVKLYETSNNIEFVYGPTTPGVTGADGLRFATVGIKGSGASAGQTVLVNKTSSAAAWSTAVFITGEYGASAFNYRRASPADAGRTFRFVPAVLPANDIAVAGIYSLGQISSTYYPAHVVTATVTNNSATTKTNIPVTLTVAGVNTFTNVQTVASLASGASTTVSFAAYPLTTSGANTLTVTVPADDVATNNSKTFAQNVSTDRLSYIEAGQPFAGSISVSSTTAGGSLAVRFNAITPTVVNSIKPTFTGAPTGAAPTYRVDLVTAAGASSTPTGTVLYSSPVLTRPTVAATPVTANISVPNVAVPAGDFFVVFREVSGGVALAYQSEDPLRANTFYFQTSATGAWTLVNTTTLRTRIAVELGLGTVTASRQELGAGQLAVFPNPAVSGDFTVSLPAIADQRTAQITLLNTLGQQVHTRTVQLLAAGTQAKVDVSSLAKGLYTLRVQAGGQVATKQVVVE